MPGIHLIVDLDRDVNDLGASIDRARSELLFSDNYVARELFRRPHVFAGFTAYEAYPMSRFEDDRVQVVVEGKVYDQGDVLLKENLLQLAETVFLGLGDPLRTIKAWLTAADGDFIVLMMEKASGRLLVFNDVLSRLPLYYHVAANRLVLSRDILFLRSFAPEPRLHPMGAAEYLLFGYPLGTKTLLENVLRLPPATCIRINPLDRRIRFHSLCLFDFSRKEHRRKTRKENARNLADLFTIGLMNRAAAMEDCTKLVSLSGGLDSRAVAAGLAGARIAFSCASFLDDQERAGPDVSVAEHVARVLEAEWTCFGVGPGGAGDRDLLLKAKQGLNNVSMGFILPFLRRVRERFGERTVLFTGDGGDRIKPHLKKNQRIGSMDALVDYTLLKNRIFPLEVVSRLTGISAPEILENLKHIFMSYPEQSLKDKYVHFLVYESALRLVFEGEDRNRHVLWSLTPFYSLPFFEYAMNCPDRQKRYYGLYRRFLMELRPEVCTIPNVDWNRPVSPATCLALFAYQNAPGRVKGFIAKRKNAAPLKEGTRRDMEDRVREQIRNGSSIHEFLSPRELDEVISRGCDVNQYDSLLTLVTCMAFWESGPRSSVAEEVVG